MQILWLILTRLVHTSDEGQPLGAFLAHQWCRFASSQQLGGAQMYQHRPFRLFFSLEISLMHLHLVLREVPEDCFVVSTKIWVHDTWYHKINNYNKELYGITYC